MSNPSTASRVTSRNSTLKDKIIAGKANWLWCLKIIGIWVAVTNLGVLIGIWGMGGSILLDNVPSQAGVSDYASQFLLLQTWALLILGTAAYFGALIGGWQGSLHPDILSGELLIAKKQHENERDEDKDDRKKAIANKVTKALFVVLLLFLGAAGVFIGGVHQVAHTGLSKATQMFDSYSLYTNLINDEAKPAGMGTPTVNCELRTKALNNFKTTWSQPYVGINAHGVNGVMFMATAKADYLLGCINTNQLFALNSFWQGVIARDKLTQTWLYTHMPIGWSEGKPWSLADMDSLITTKVPMTQQAWCEAQGQKQMGMHATANKEVQLQNYCGKIPNATQAIDSPAAYTLPTNWAGLKS